MGKCILRRAFRQNILEIIRVMDNIHAENKKFR
jgi:hypothetical protein